MIEGGENRFCSQKYADSVSAREGDREITPNSLIDAGKENTGISSNISSSKVVQQLLIAPFGYKGVPQGKYQCCLGRRESKSLTIDFPYLPKFLIVIFLQCIV